MKYFGLLLLGSIVLVKCSPAVQSGDEINPFVMGGAIANVGEFPSLVLIEIRDPTEHCGGTIVNNLHVVTAAHCLVGVVNNRYETIHSNLLRIIAGDRNFRGPVFGRVIRHVSNVFIHPQFNQYSLENDIAVLRLSEPFDLPDNFIESAVRRRRIVPIGDICVFAGWGRTAANVNSPMTPLINRLNIPILTHDACNGLSVHNGRVLESMICGGVLNANQASVCHGNQGSGLYCNNELTGILSFGVGCGVGNSPGVYTQVRFFNDWLDEQFARNDTAELSIW